MTKFIKKRWKMLVSLVAIGALGYYVGVGRGPQTEDLTRALRSASDFTLPDLQDKHVRLSDFKGKVVLLDFWATWCLPCIEELPDLKAVYQKYKDKGFVIVGVSLDEAGKGLVSGFVGDNQVPYVIVMAGGVDKAPEGYPLRGLPMAYLIDPDGMIRKRYVGFKFREELEKDIESFLPAQKRGD